MHALIVLSHPEPQSFNAAMARQAALALTRAGHTVDLADLHAEGFDPVSDRRNFTTTADPIYLKLQAEEMQATGAAGFAPDLERQIARLEAADLLILQFPLWWFGLPAMLKGWVDRSFAMGRIYGDGRMYDTGRFRGRRALLSLTTGGAPAGYTPDGLHGDIDGVLRPIRRGILEFVGFDLLASEVVWQPARLTEAGRAAALDRWAARLARIGTETPEGAGRY